ncbi:MAG: T9SS type A sorting domain-containing protein, partial [Ignavibacteriales bacterium]|nr:T9SS type A sorting domain-containing protein [Ignavibacteriales bacterium]
NTSSQVYFTENFNYTAGDSIGAHGWLWNTGTTNTIFVATPGLTYAGYPLSNIGNSCRLRNNGNDAYKNMSDSVTTGNVYASFMVNIDSAQVGLGDYFFALINNTTTNYTARFYAKDSSGGVAFGISKNASGSNPIVWSGGTYARNTTYLVVIKYTFNTGSTTDDEVRAYIFTSGVPGTEPGSPTIGPATGTSTDLTSIVRVAMRQGSATLAPTLNIDGIQVFRTWGSLVGVSNISTVAENFSLSQNYPNPFNPSTKINFSIPERSFVTMKVYDMLGKEVMTLVNSNYSAGTYAVDMNAASLSTGIYMYSIEARTESGNILKDTKKLTLVK